jgi:hypothetical protein
MDPNVSILFPPPPVQKPLSKKCPDIETLSTYTMPPPQGFWRTFPSRPLPSSPVSNIDFGRLKTLAETVAPFFTESQVVRAERTVYELQHGSTAPLLYELPGIRVPNTRSAAEHGEEFTDTLAWWIRCGYVSGPFAAPPTSDFRTNSMIAVEQKDKIRIVMVPKCEIFDPVFFTSRNPIWVGDLRTGEKKIFFEDHGRYSPFCFFYAG